MGQIAREKGKCGLQSHFGHFDISERNMENFWWLEMARAVKYAFMNSSFDWFGRSLGEGRVSVVDLIVVSNVT